MKTPLHCPVCGISIDGLTPTVGDDAQVPVAGNVNVCASCGGVSMFTDDDLRLPTEEERAELESVGELKEALKVFRELKLRSERTIVFSGVDPSYLPLANVTFPIMDTWARRQGYDFRGFLSVPGGLNAYWTGVACGLELLLGGYKRIIYLDADQFITNLNVNFDHIDKGGFHASKDWGSDATEPWHFSMCGFVAHRDCIKLFQQVLSMEPEWRDKPFQEQGPFQDVVRHMMECNTDQAAPKITIHPRKVFNNVPDQVAPGNVPEPWAPGDFAAHLTMVPMNERLELAKEFAMITIQHLKQCAQADTSSTISGDPFRART